MPMHNAPSGATERERRTNTHRNRSYDRDVSAAYLRYWLHVLPVGEAKVLGRLIDQVYIFTNGSTERSGISRAFLISGELDGVEIIPPLGFKDRQFHDYIRGLKKRGLVNVIQKGRGRVAYTINAAAILTKGCGSTATLQSGRAAVQPHEGLRSDRVKGCGPTEVLKSHSKNSSSNEGLPNPAAPDGRGGEDLDFDEERCAYADEINADIAPLDRTIRSERGRFAGSTPHDVEAIKLTIEPLPDDIVTDPVAEIEQVWALAHDHVGKTAAPFDAAAAAVILAYFDHDLDDAVAFVGNAVVHWERAMGSRFAWMQKRTPPRHPDLPFIAERNKRRTHLDAFIANDAWCESPTAIRTRLGLPPTKWDIEEAEACAEEAEARAREEEQRSRIQRVFDVLPRHHQKLVEVAMKRGSTMEDALALYHLLPGQSHGPADWPDAA